MKKNKRKKLEPLGRVRRRLMRLWTEKVHDLGGNACAVCGKRMGEVDQSNGKPVVINAHHLQSRDIDPGLRWDERNGICLCVSHHKYGHQSAHKSPLWFVDWLQKNRPDQYSYVMSNMCKKVDINDRAWLASVEKHLNSVTNKKGASV